MSAGRYIRDGMEVATSGFSAVPPATPIPAKASRINASSKGLRAQLAAIS